MISAVVVVYGPSPELAALLASLKRSAPVDLELIVVVNPSPDGQAELPDDHALVIRNEINVGFGQAVNQAALAASGEFLLILNSDIEMPPGWAEELLRPFRDLAVAAVAPALVDPDGTVQELGSFVGAQGETVAFGRGIAAALADDLYEHPVDYASAACLLVRRDSFHKVGGFHPIYGLGYFEDVELAFALRRLGMRTQLVPSVQVVHHRESSFGESAASELMNKNRRIFVERWSESLLGRPALTDFEKRPYRLVHARDWHMTERVLVVATQAGDLIYELDRLHAEEPELAIVLVASEIPSGLSSAIRHVTFDNFAAWSEQYSYWASLILSQGQVPSEVVTILQTTQNPHHSQALELGQSLVASVASLRGRG